jgi:hypothetical protein
MTSELAFECLFISSDPELFRVVARILRELSITMEICLRPSRALEVLNNRNADLVVLDWEAGDSAELMQTIRNETRKSKPTLVAISSSDSRLPGAHMVIKKPITAETGAESFKSVYKHMLVDYRRKVRHALMTPVVATTEDGREVSLMVTDISDGGVGLSSKEGLQVGDVLSFRLVLPGAPREVLVHVRVLWTREYSRLGCEFLRIPPVDLMILHDWLKAKSRVKKPRIEI